MSVLRSRLARLALLQPRRTLFAYSSGEAGEAAAGGAGGGGGGGRQRSLVEECVRAETRRQRDELVLIASESMCFSECEALVASAFGNIYAEGQPALRLSRRSEELAKDAALFRAWHRRLSDGRFYQGCMEADRVELLAKQYVAEAFALLQGSPPADKIYANVQALSGSPANLALYQALLNNGDPMLTLNLSHGGHLSHGSPFNVSGKQYKVTQYSIDPNTRLLNYDSIERLALQSRPKMIVAGASAYPWDWDWERLRSIADKVGAMLHADVCHPAGLILGGVLRNPLPYADTVMFTTHKTLMGPRGSVIVTKCKEKARKIDNAVFPGMQGGPHMNSIAGIARLFEIIVHQNKEYRDLQQRIVSNAKVFADALKKEGFDLEYNGTENHLMLLDLKRFNVKEGNKLDGETAARLLEIVGIICNKNTLPGDATAAQSSGLRVATPWISQRGISDDQIRQLASIMGKLLRSATGFQIWAPSGDERCRARVPYNVLKECEEEVRTLARSLPYPKLDESIYGDELFDPLADAVTVKGYVPLLVRGEKARLGLDQALTCNVLGLGEKDHAVGKLLLPTGEEISTVVVSNLGHRENKAAGPNGEERLAVLVPQTQIRNVYHWLTSLSDGYVELVPGDPYMKVDGPFVVEAMAENEIPAHLSEALQGTLEPAMEMAKPFFVGQQTVVKPDAAPALPAFAYKPVTGQPKKTVLNEWHRAHGGDMVDFGGWDMPVKYKTSIAEEHRAVRTSAAIFDVSHMSAVAFQGPHALSFLELVLANTAARLANNEAQYSYMLREDGAALDDAYVYRFGAENFMVVFNAGNFERDYAWITAVNEGQVCIDTALPFKTVTGKTKITPLRDAGPDSKLDLALQGPKALEIVKKLTPKDQQEILSGGRLNDIHHLKINGIDVVAARTGYTGEEVGFELFVHPSETVKLWETLLDAGKPYGMLPAGLGARDSARIEAGLPLFGHELEGAEQLSLTEADYGYVSRFHRPFYIGRKPYIERTHPRHKRILRLRGQGRRSVREGHDLVLSEGGESVGHVTSFAFSDDEFTFHVLAAVDANLTVKPGDLVYGQRKGKGPTVPLTVLTRFPTAEEKGSWRHKYGKKSQS